MGGEGAAGQFRSRLPRREACGEKIEPRASAVVYRTKEHALLIELRNGAVITLPVKLIPNLRRATPRDIRAVEILGRGGGLHFESLDLDLSVPGLFSYLFARLEWLAELGRVGDRKTSVAKAAAA